MTSTAPIGTSKFSLPPLLSLNEGDLLNGRYRLESLLHARPASVLFAATDLKTGTRVVAHVLVAPGSVEGVHDSSRVAFLAGARRAKVLSSPHAARILDVGVTTEGHPWSVREHLVGDTLRAHLRKTGALATGEAVDVALAVCDAIAEAHAHDLLHLSLGTHAVHVAWSASGPAEVKVTGVGTASAETAIALGPSGDVECVLRSPEQLLHGTEVDARADVWAIGVLLHTMLAGAPPFSADTPSGASLSVVIDDPPFLAGVPDELAELVERTLSKDLERRPRSVLELAEAIVSFASQPDVARERIANRRGPLELVFSTESDPTLIVEEFDYDALAHEQNATKPPAADVPTANAPRAPLPPPKVPPPKAPAADTALRTKPPSAKPTMGNAPAGRTLAFKALTFNARATKPANAPETITPVAGTSAAKALAATAPIVVAEPLATDTLATTAKEPAPKAPAKEVAAEDVVTKEVAIHEVVTKEVATNEVAAKEPAPPPTNRESGGPSDTSIALDSDDLIVDVASVRELVPSEPVTPLLPTLVTTTSSAQVTRRESRIPRRALQVIGLMGAAACIVLVGTEGARLSRQAPPTSENATTAATIAAATTVPSPILSADLPAPVIRPGDLPPVAPPSTTTPPAKVATPVAPPNTAHAAVATAKPPPMPPAPEAPRASATPAAPKDPLPSASAASTTASQPSPSGSADDLRRFLDDRR
jgi:serine/threonine-protein kinase